MTKNAPGGLSRHCLSTVQDNQAIYSYVSLDATLHFNGGASPNGCDSHFQVLRILDRSLEDLE